MIIYRELSSLSDDLGFSERTLYSISNHISRYYRSVRIPKRNGEYRQLNVPKEPLKSIQKRIAERLLPLEAISSYAAAYHPGASTKKNAAAHVGKNVILKLDIRHFFDHIIYTQIKEKAFPADRYSEQNRILLAILCTFHDSLPQGAPTSPAISNIIMRDFDDAVGKWCGKRGVAYTRYCDDMTFSCAELPAELIPFVKEELKKCGFFLNDRKTVTAKQGQRQHVTGIVVNERASVPSEYKRKIRQEIYYCEKYGVDSHISKLNPESMRQEYLSGLLGRINYVLSVEPDNKDMRDYKRIVVEWRKE